ncbi:MAG TPA: cupin domain-containing protein [Ktedonosporobacter sp.]|nr:cupin domain-containing protein [Ktedonosporobacter sp.]
MKIAHLFDQDAVELSPQIYMQGFTGEKLMVTHIVFEAGAFSAPHSHPHEQLTVVLRGELRFTLGEETQILRAGDAISIPSDIPHSAVAITETELLDVFTPVRDDLMAKLS